MSDLHEAHDQEQAAGWLLWAIAVAIITAATIGAYRAHDTTVANAPMSQEVAAR